MKTMHNLKGDITFNLNGINWYQVKRYLLLFTQRFTYSLGDLGKSVFLVHVVQQQNRIKKIACKNKTCICTMRFCSNFTSTWSKYLSIFNNVWRNSKLPMSASVMVT